MNFPGFTAEASVYAPHNRYRAAALGWGASQGVALAGAPKQLVLAANCYRDCLNSCDDDPYYCEVNCHCYCRGGPPHCHYQ
jgi:hypothetical protein